MNRIAGLLIISLRAMFRIKTELKHNAKKSLNIIMLACIVISFHGSRVPTFAKTNTIIIPILLYFNMSIIFLCHTSLHAVCYA